MNYYEYRQKLYNGEKTTLDGDYGSSGQIGASSQGKSAGSNDNSAKPIAEFSRANKILSADELIAHRKHCRAKPGNCPFEKAVDEADDITSNNIKVTKQVVFTRLANMLTQMFQVAKNLAKPAIVDPEKVESIPVQDSNENGTKDKATTDEAPKADTNEDAKLVAEVIEGGIEKMVELAKSKGCSVEMDENNTKYIVKGPVAE